MMNEMSEITIKIGNTALNGILEIPPNATGLVLFAHGAGSSRLSPRNTQVAKELNDAGLATLLFDLLTEAEDEVYENRFKIELLTERLVAVTHWVQEQPELKKLPLGYFGASTGAACALDAAAQLPGVVKAVVSRGGRPDLATKAEQVQTPTLLIVGGEDSAVIEMNRSALLNLPGTKKMEIIPGASHLFEEPGTMEQVSDLARDWFIKYLK